MFTDFIWLLLFGGFIALNVILVAPTLFEGDLYSLARFYDSQGTRCGVATAAAYPYT